MSRLVHQVHIRWTRPWRGGRLGKMWSKYARAGCWSRRGMSGRVCITCQTSSWSKTESPIPLLGRMMVVEWHPDFLSCFGIEWKSASENPWFPDMTWGQDSQRSWLLDRDWALSCSCGGNQQPVLCQWVTRPLLYIQSFVSHLHHVNHKTSSLHVFYDATVYLTTMCAIWR